jgi:hypothetical protein
MTEENTGANDTVTSSNDTVAASNADTVVSGASDTVVSSGNDTVVANEFSWNTYLDGIKQKDEKLYNVAKTASSVDDVVKQNYELQKRISQGFKEPELPKNATEAQIKEYREKIGVPAAPNEYKFPENVAVKEEDKPLWDLFGKFAIENNISQKDFTKLAPAYYAMEASIREQAEKDFKEVTRSQDGAIKELWGSDAADNMKANEAFLINAGGEELAQMLLGATSADGRPLGNNPLVAKWLNEQARAFGYADVMSAGKSDGKSIDDQINEILQRKTSPDYYHVKNKAKADKDHAEYLRLLEIKEKLKK